MAESSRAVEAVTHLLDNDLGGLLEAVREKYWRQAGLAGVILLPDPGPKAHLAYAGLTGKRLRRGDLRVDLSDLDRALANSYFQCSIVDVLTARFGADLPTKHAERTRQETHRARIKDQWLGALQEISDSRPAASPARRWLEESPHGVEWLVGRYGRELPRGDEPVLRDLRLVADSLDRLPLASPWLLATFAASVGGDPHGLDYPGTNAGRLFFLALADLFGPELGLEEGPAERLPAESRRELYEYVGLVRDTLSSRVAVYGLANAVRQDGSFEPFVPLTAGRVVTLSLQDLLGWRSVIPSRADVYILENPAALLGLVSWLEAGAGTGTLVCTFGWPSGAALRLLDLMALGDPGCRFHYNGDFDPGGLRIATFLIRRYPGRLTPWLMDVDSYNGVASRGVPTGEEAGSRSMVGIDPIFEDVLAAINRSGTRVYQEAITDVLCRALPQP